MTERPELEIEPSPPRQPVRWIRAVRAVRALIADADDTAKAIDVFYAVGRQDFERWFQQFCADPRGREMLIEGPSLADALSDREALERMPEGSFGRAYLAYLDRNGFRPTALVELQQQVHARWQAEEGIPALGPQRAFFSARLQLTHDLLHVLTDYGTDGAGEATLLAFDLPSRRGWANALLTLGAAFEMWRFLGVDWARYVFRAWRRGRRAAWLALLPLEELLPLRLETVRRIAGIEPTRWAHPEGILAGRNATDLAWHRP